MIGLSVEFMSLLGSFTYHSSFTLCIGGEWLEKLTRSNFFAIAMCKVAYGKGEKDSIFSKRCLRYIYN